ncbi:MAG: TolC family protein [Kofleriaceae bacterium]
MKRLAAVLLLAAASAHADAPGASPQKLTFQGAIELSLGQNPDIALAKEAVAGAEAHVSGQKAHRWIALNVNASVNRWRDAYAVDFPGLGSFTLHENVTTATTVAVSQPLTGLAYLSELVDATEHDAKATRKAFDRARLDTAYHTADAYLRVLEARAGATVAHQSVDDIQAGLDLANKLRAADTYTDIDVLRFKSAKAAADQTAMRADTSAQTSLAALTVQLGLPDGSPIEITDDLPPAAPALAMSLQQAQDRAMTARPELAAAREKIASANNQRVAAREKYLPDVRGVAVWLHNTGVQPFSPEDEEFIGLTASWNVWDWGATHDAVLEAERAQNRATITANATGEQVKLDVRRHWLEAKTQFDSLAVAQQEQQTAEEAYRLEKVKFDNAAATTTDVLDAETDVARARLGIATARYDYYLALVALARSVGDLPDPK